MSLVVILFCRARPRSRELVFARKTRISHTIISPSGVYTPDKHRDILSRDRRVISRMRVH